MNEDHVRLRFDSFQSFLDECSARISEDGIFLATEAIRPIGSTVEFDVGIDSEFPILRGTGEVVWVVEPNGEGGETPGMAVRYRDPDEATATVARRVAERQRARAGAAFSLDPPRSAAVAPVSEVPAEPPAAEPSPPTAEETIQPSGDALTLPDLGEESPSFATQAVEALIVDDAEQARAPWLAAETTALPSDVQAELAAAELEDTRTESAGGRKGLWVALALVALAAGAAYWQRDLLLQTLGGGSPGTAEPPIESVEPPVSEPMVLEPAEPVTQEVSDIEAIEPESQPSADRQPRPEPSGPLSRIEDIRWTAGSGGTVLELLADGSFPADAYEVERLDDPPRVLVKIAGVVAPLDRPTRAIGTEEVVGVRTGLHGSPPSTTLHVVIDLADPTAQVGSLEADGSVLQVRVASSAISP